MSDNYINMSKPLSKAKLERQIRIEKAKQTYIRLPYSPSRCNLEAIKKQKEKEEMDKKKYQDRVINFESTVGREHAVAIALVETDLINYVEWEINQEDRERMKEEIAYEFNKLQEKMISNHEKSSSSISESIKLLQDIKNVSQLSPSYDQFAKLTALTSDGRLDKLIQKLSNIL